MHQDRVPEGEIRANLVAVAAPIALVREVARLLELRDDALNRALRDAHLLREIADPALGIPGDAEQHVAVVGEEGPRSSQRS